MVSHFIWPVILFSPSLTYASPLKPIAGAICATGIKTVTEFSSTIQEMHPDKMTPELLHGEKIWEVSLSSHQSTGVVRFAVAPGIGASTVALDAKVNGKILHVFPVRDLNAIDKNIEKDPNFPFKQVNTPLFPLTNRLLPARSSPPLQVGDTFEATVAGIRVRMPLNNRASSEGAIPHHLHGLSFDQRPTAVFYDESDATKIVADYHDFFRNFWTSQAELRIEQSIDQKGSFRYSATARNSGDQAMPVAFGTHPYFQMPSGNPAKVKLMIPAQLTADIDNLDNVLPRGTFSPVSRNANRLNFSQGKSLPEGVIDNYFLLDPNQKKEVQLVDEEAKVRYRFTGLTDNIIGVQIYYPGTGSVIAIELVTNHPDPREELWGTIPTGMQVLKPGESAHYAYEISVESL